MTENRWRKDLVSKIKRQLIFLKDRNVQFPESLEIISGAKGNLFELGGQDHNSGIAMIVASPSGKPSFSRILHHRWPNEIHAAVNVWPGCLVALGSHHMGKECMAIYVIQEIIPPKDGEKFGSAILKRVAYRTPQGHTGAGANFWYETEMEIPAADRLVGALREKLYTYNCTEPLYIEWFHSIKNHEKTALLDHLKQIPVKQKDKIGIGDSTIKRDAICSTFEQFMESIRLAANDLNENFKDKFVWVMFGFSIKEEKLLCQARLMTNAEGALYPVKTHDTLYQISLEDDDVIGEYMNQYNPMFHKVVFGFATTQLMIKHLYDNGGTVSTIVKYAKCTARPLPAKEKQEPIAQAVPAVEESEDVLSQESPTNDDVSIPTIPDVQESAQDSSAL